MVVVVLLLYKYVGVVLCSLGLLCCNGGVVVVVIVLLFFSKSPSLVSVVVAVLSLVRQGWNN